MLPANVIANIAEYMSIASMRLVCKDWCKYVHAAWCRRYPGKLCYNMKNIRNLTAHDINPQLIIVKNCSRGNEHVVECMLNRVTLQQPYLTRAVHAAIDSNNADILRMISSRYDIASIIRNCSAFSINTLPIIFDYIYDDVPRVQSLLTAVLTRQTDEFPHILSQLDINCKYKFDTYNLQPILQQAIREHKFAAATHLIKMQNGKHRLNNAQTMLAAACTTLDNAVITFLYKHYNHYNKFGINIAGGKILRELTISNNLPAVKFLIKAHNASAFTHYHGALIELVKYNYIDMFKYIVSVFPIKNIKIKYNKIVKLACTNNHIELFKYIWSNWYANDAQSKQLIHKYAKQHGNPALAAFVINN